MVLTADLIHPYTLQTTKSVSTDRILFIYTVYCYFSTVIKETRWLMADINILKIDTIVEMITQKNENCWMLVWLIRELLL